MSRNRRTGWVTHEYFFWHDTGNYAGCYKPGEYLQPARHWESPESKRRFKSLIDVSNLKNNLIHIEPRQATIAELERVHNSLHISNMQSLSAANGGLMGDGESPFGPFGFEIACLAAGGAIAAADAVYKDEVDVAYALIRPPGHHAIKDHGMGFCMFNNIAVAIEHLKATSRLRNFAVIDWDVHHGNGTQAIYYDNPNVLTISLHQDDLYPRHSGTIHETGENDGVGFNINVPLPVGSGDGAYRYAFEQIVNPAIKRFAPELIFIASGFDANYYDPLARMCLHADTYNWMAKAVLELADEFSKGRVVATHEGGYSDIYVPYCGLAVIEAFLGKTSEITDPMATLGEVKSRQDQQLHRHQKEIIDECKKANSL
ncbi:MAG: class II histone deacetylase [Nitrospiraceae bacterium]|nr:class II histone deacetylase [Nitrospiraceae bacterium]